MGFAFCVVESVQPKKIKSDRYAPTDKYLNQLRWKQKDFVAKLEMLNCRLQRKGYKLRYL